MYVTYSDLIQLLIFIVALVADLIQLLIFIVALVGLCYEIFKDKRK